MCINYANKCKLIIVISLFSEIIEQSLNILHLIMNIQGILISFVFSFIQHSYQQNAKITCDSDFSCVISGVHNISELNLLGKLISSGVYVNNNEPEINISQIQAIQFVNSSFNEIPDGFFDERLFKELEEINISGVGLRKFNLKDAYIGKVYFVDIRHNSLNTIGMKGFPQRLLTKLNTIEIDNNNWKCIELLPIIVNLTLHKIFATATTDSTKLKSTNIYGIECMCGDEQQILMKLNQFIGKLDEYELKDQKLKDNLKNITEQMEKMKSRFIEGNKEISAALLVVQNMTKACTYSKTMDVINITSQDINDISDGKNKEIFDSYIFKVVDASFEDIFKGYEDISKIIKNLKKIIVETATIKAEPKMLGKIVEISLITLCFVVLAIGVFMIRTRIVRLCSTSSISQSNIVSYSALNEL